LTATSWSPDRGGWQPDTDRERVGCSCFLTPKNAQHGPETLKSLRKNNDLANRSSFRQKNTRTLPEIATDYARTIYNQQAILRILTYQSKEGQFLLNGVLVKNPSGNKMEELPSGFGDFPYKTGLLNNRVDDLIKCNMNGISPSLERITYTGKGVIFGEQTQKVTPVDYNDLENIIPGFTFLNEPCDPCGSMAENPDYSCAYRLKVKDNPPFISNVWQYLWRINDNNSQ
jgi:hypothetical protein